MEMVEKKEGIIKIKGSSTQIKIGRVYKKNFLEKYDIIYHILRLYGKIIAKPVEINKFQIQISLILSYLYIFISS